MKNARFMLILQIYFNSCLIQINGLGIKKEEVTSKIPLNLSAFNVCFPSSLYKSNIFRTTPKNFIHFLVKYRSTGLSTFWDFKHQHEIIDLYETVLIWLQQWTDIKYIQICFLLIVSLFIFLSGLDSKICTSNLFELHN